MYFLGLGSAVSNRETQPNNSFHEINVSVSCEGFEVGHPRLMWPLYGYQGLGLRPAFCSAIPRVWPSSSVSKMKYKPLYPHSKQQNEGRDMNHLLRKYAPCYHTTFLLISHWPYIAARERGNADFILI